MAEMTERRKQAIIEMANRGTKKEKDIAKSLIEKLDISIKDCLITDFDFKYKNKIEKRLLLQIWLTVTDKKSINYHTNKKKRNTLIFNLTETENLELKMFYSVYRRELKKEIELTYIAFINQNGIFPPSSKAKESDKSLEEQEKLFLRINSIDKITIRKQIEKRGIVI